MTRSDEASIAVQDVSVSRQDPDDPTSLFDVEIVLTGGSGDRTVFEWEVELEDASETTVRSVENLLFSAIEGLVEDGEYRLPDDQVVIGARLRQALGQRGIEVEQ
ncbi:hypothetical protein [Gordonia polyisoprenivorans]|uniref:Uncharacterized protein n=1 Tax=Gordonia polyisoprenivorans TaxID=84595 RepID=A0A846WS61_9ACTN|nr:hypothetical protein [Gordonia polyisoprenivorans]NKY04375.1 hypothetical protein [Gordonia polyisoprenivorans]